MGQGGSVGKDGLRVPPTRISVTELARGRKGPLQGHTAGSNNTYYTGQTVSQNNFIVPKIGVESKAETWTGRGHWEGREKEGEDAKIGEGGLWETGGLEKGSPRVSAVLGMNRVRWCEFISLRRIPIDPAPDAGSQEQGSGTTEVYQNTFRDKRQWHFCVLVSSRLVVLHSHDENRL